MMAMLGNALCMLCVLAALALILFGCIKAGQMMEEEAAREALRRQTAAAMRTDRHLDRLRRQKMRVQYERRARIW